MSSNIGHDIGHIHTHLVRVPVSMNTLNTKNIQLNIEFAISQNNLNQLVETWPPDIILSMVNSQGEVVIDNEGHLGVCYI